jgi:hypothetical protein
MGTRSTTEEAELGGDAATVFKLIWGLIDWGKNRQNVERILQQATEALAVPATAGRGASSSPATPGLTAAQAPVTGLGRLRSDGRGAAGD